MKIDNLIAADSQPDIRNSQTEDQFTHGTIEQHQSQYIKTLATITQGQELKTLKERRAEKTRARAAQESKPILNPNQFFETYNFGFAEEISSNLKKPNAGPKEAEPAGAEAWAQSLDLSKHSGPRYKQCTVQPALRDKR